MKKLYRFMVLGLAALTSCQQPFEVVEEQKLEEGRILDWIWDAVSVGLGMKSASENLSRGDVGAASIDVAGVVVDTVAAAIPGVPGGVGAARAATRAAGDVAANAGRVADDLTNVGTIRNFDVHPSTPVGRRGSPMDVPRGTNTPTVIGERTYTGHALDQMQGRGFTPSVVEDTIARGTRSPGYDGATVYTTQQARVVVSPNGSVKTVIPQ